jgi:hypothetical protein
MQTYRIKRKKQKGKGKAIIKSSKKSKEVVVTKYPYCHISFSF